jgi:hypothetical protein
MNTDKEKIEAAGSKSKIKIKSQVPKWRTPINHVIFFDLAIEFSLGFWNWDLELQEGDD